ncbi:hypothetical protein JCM10213_007398 [Rhodosporidiobolus nylandii]
MPIRLPPKPKKGKQKQVNIDYSSLEAARTSAPADWTHDDFLEDGTKQEEQGERYQIGAKAARHFHNATTSYRLAASLSPTSFDARYNAARALQTLATEHLAPPACLEALAQAIEAYREALVVLGEGSGGTARIDALFNLAQADVALFEMLEEGVAVVEGEVERALQAAREAKGLFVEVERLQRVEMEKVFGADGPQDEEAGGAMDETASAAGSATEVQAMETTIVTPHLIVDTLLESIALDVALFSSVSDPEDQTALPQSALDSLSRANTLRTLIPRSNSPPQPDELDLELSLAHVSILTSTSPASDEATALLQSTASALPAPRVEVLSAYADNLLDSLPLTAQPFPTLLATLEQALQVYQQSASLLSNRLSPPKNTPSAHLPSLLATNLVAQATVHLLVYTLSSRALSLDVSLSASLQPEKLREHLLSAHQLALDATAACKSGLSLAVSSSSPPSALKPTLALARAPASQDPRSDWRTLSALRAALFTLARVRLRLDPSAEAWDSEKKQFWALWRAVGLGRSGGAAGSEEERRLREREVRWWAEETGEDKVAEAMDEADRTRERAWWAALAE